MKPWEIVIIVWWRKLTKGKRRYVTIPVFLAFIIVPAIASFSKDISFLYSHLLSLTSKRTVVLSEGEKALIIDNEWGLLVETTESKEEAEKDKQRFIKAYLDARHLNWKKQPIWQNDIYVLRDPRQRGRWVIAIDMYAGSSSREAILTGIDEMKKSETLADVRGAPLTRWLDRAIPYQFTRSEFESHYGQITDL